jgi:Cu(I)/Ag(I) efflux system membrane protein CusA/SilA
VLSDVADIRVVQGPPMLRSENARLSGWIYVDIRGRDLRSAVKDMQAAVTKAVPMPAGYALSWSGQFEYLERASAKLQVVVPFTLLIIFVLLYLVFGRSGCCICSAITCRWPESSASLRSPGWRPNSA